MKTIPALISIALSAGPALSQPVFVAPVLPAEPCARWAYELTATNKLCPPSPLTGRRPSAEDRAWQDQQASRYCRMAKDLRLVNGTVLAQEGQLHELGTVKASWDVREPATYVHGSFAQLVKPCTAEQRQAMAAANAELMLNSGVYGLGGYSGGGRVFVRAHTRCNSSKCWPVRSYTRSR